MWVVISCKCAECGHEAEAWGPFDTEEEALAFEAPYVSTCAHSQVVRLVKERNDEDRSGRQ